MIKMMSMIVGVIAVTCATVVEPPAWYTQVNREMRDIELADPTDTTMAEVEVVVFYIPDVTDSMGSQKSVDSLIDANIAEMNQVYVNSNVYVHFTCIYREEMPFAWYYAYNPYTLENDFPRISFVRDSVGADLASVWLIGGGGAQMSYTGDASRYLNTVYLPLEKDSSTFGLQKVSRFANTYIHETMHAFNVKDSTGKIFYDEVDEHWYSTFMQYAHMPDTVFVPYIANQGVFYNGTELTSGTNNGDIINGTRFIVENFRNSGVTPIASPSVALQRVSPLSLVAIPNGWRVETANKSDMTYSILTLSGKIIASGELRESGVIDHQNLSGGVYLLQVKTKIESTNFRVTIK